MRDEPRMRLDDDGRVILDTNPTPEERAAMILACPLCDTDGLRHGFPCDHTDRTQTHRRGIAAVRAALASRPQPPQTTPEKPPTDQPEGKNTHP